MANILVVDDDTNVVQHVRTVLSEMGYEVKFITQPTFLMDRLEKESFDLLLLDIYMPQTDGITLLKLLKNHAVFHEIPVIMLTGEENDQTLANCFDHGATDYLTKPIKQLILKARVKNALTSKFEQDRSKKYMEELEQYKNHLEKLIRSRTRELQQTNEKLQHEIWEHQQKEAYLRVLTRAIESLTEGVLITDPHTRGHQAVYANEAYLRLTGYSVEEVIGQPVNFLDGEHTDTLAMEQIRQSIMKHTVYRGELMTYQKNGTPFWNELTLSPVFDPMGQASHFVWVQRDVTARKVTEETLMEINEQLVVTNHELKNTQAQLVQSSKLASLGEMATGIAHELNQPLSTIQMSSKNYLRSIDRGHQEDPIPTIQKILKQVERASLIINYLRVFGRDTQHSSRSEHDLSQIIHNSFTLINRQLEHQNIQIFMHFPIEPLPLINCYPVQIEQVLINLLMNAKDALTGREHKMIHIRVYMKDTWIVTEVEDNGTGIPAEIQDKIFDPFFTTKEVGAGTGLGLSISYGILQDHGGRLEVHSDGTTGTCFHVYLPVVQPKQ
ncbi:MAG: response regulator [SAR324 cluster bacterium]|nr:response regulator [SAR324 cluster bacterium]